MIKYITALILISFSLTAQTKDTIFVDNYNEFKKNLTPNHYNSYYKQPSHLLYYTIFY